MVVVVGGGRDPSEDAWGPRGGNSRQVGERHGLHIHTWHAPHVHPALSPPQKTNRQTKNAPSLFVDGVPQPVVVIEPQKHLVGDGGGGDVEGRPELLHLFVVVTFHVMYGKEKGET